MKNIRPLLAVTILTIALTGSALAGDMHTTGVNVAPPVPPPPTHLRVADLPDETISASDALTETALLFCHQVLSII